MDVELFSARYAIAARPLAGVAPACLAEVDAADWLRIAQRMADEGSRLVALWGSERMAGDLTVSAAYCASDGLLWLCLPLRGQDSYPDLSAIFPFANRMQRALYDLQGLRARGADDTRPWLNHGAWPEHHFPLRQQYSGLERFAVTPRPYPFVQVEGEGVHEIAVGPIHAGIIEPGHFRFSVVGEKVLRLEAQFGWVHKGIDKLFIGRQLGEGARIAARVSGDSTVAFAWAYSMAAEGVAGCTVPARARWLRALMLERERVANHLGDLGAIGNDAGLAIGLAQFARLKEDWVRLNHQAFGHRFMMDRVVPGGVACELADADASAMLAQCARIEHEVQALRRIYDDHAGLQDRLITAGRVVPKLAAQLGLCGLAGRASGQAWDARADQAIAPYDELDVNMATHRNGDVAARVIVRFDELFESLRLLREILRRLPPGPLAAPLPAAPSHAYGLGWVEGWRGAVLVAVETDGQGRLQRCHCHDPSWQNWPVLQHAIMGNIVPDFPLINKSFNLSYAGIDL